MRVCELLQWLKDHPEVKNGTEVRTLDEFGRYGNATTIEFDDITNAIYIGDEQ